MMTAESVKRCLSRPRGGDILVVDATGSTNADLKRMALSGAEDGRVLIAKTQTAGRGRLGRTFVSEPGRGLYYSMLIRPALPAEKLLPLTGLCAVAAARAAERASGLKTGVKWVNDVILNGKKLGGILTELVFDANGGVSAAVIGIGLNLAYTKEEFELSGLGDMATSFLLEKADVDASCLAALLTEELDAMYASLMAGGTASYVEEYRRRSVTIGSPVRILYPAGPETGTALDIDDDFGLVVKKDSGETAVIRTGEVSVRGYYGYV